MKSLEEAIIEYQNEVDKYMIGAEEKKNFELFTVSNSLKRSVKDKQLEFDNLVKRRLALKKKDKYCMILDADN